MQVAENLMVGITYTLTEKDHSDIIEDVKKDSPFYFLFGAGNLLPKFEENLEGLSVGNAFAFVLEPEDAYGLVDEQAIVDLPVTAFMVDGKFAEEHVIVGEYIQMQDQEGNPLTGLVVNRGLEHVTLDFNHPMAGKTLSFSGTVVDIKTPTQEELEAHQLS